LCKKRRAQTTPIPRSARERGLKVKQMLGGRLRRKMLHVEGIAKNVNPIGFVDKEAV